MRGNVSERVKGPMKTDPALVALRQQARRMKDRRIKDQFVFPPGRKVFAQVYSRRLLTRVGYPHSYRQRVGDLLKPRALWLDTPPWSTDWGERAEVGDVTPASGTTDLVRWA